MIKFRAWDKVAKCYRKVLGIEFFPDETIMKVRVAGLQHRDSITPDQLVIEQATGLRDANGKDIYVGDVIETRSSKLQTVEFGILEYGCQNIASSFYVSDLLEDKPHTFSYDDEVIGNIHENPGMLEADE